jgi:hypothetical protein
VEVTVLADKKPECCSMCIFQHESFNEPKEKSILITVEIVNKCFLLKQIIENENTRLNTCPIA